VQFATATAWVARLGEAKRQGQLEAELKRLALVPLLVVDEVGYIPFDPEAANLMFALPAVTISAKHRATPAHFLSEVIATIGLLLVIFALARSGRSRSAPAAVGAYIGAAYWFTSSSSFANPAITIGRMFSDTFAGIAPSSAPAFIAAQIIGAALAIVVIKALYPGITPADAADIIVPHDSNARSH